MWSNGTERNLKLIEAFFPWEVSPDQNTLRTLPIRGGGLKKFHVYLSSLAAHINFQVGKRWHKMDVYKTYCHLRGTSNVEVMQVSI